VAKFKFRNTFNTIALLVRTWNGLRSRYKFESTYSRRMKVLVSSATSELTHQNTYSNIPEYKNQS